MSHTPGPWTVRAGSFAEDGMPVYEIEMTPPTLNASDARLIAAAPDLLHGARRVLDAIKGLQRAQSSADVDDSFEVLQQIETYLEGVVAKAEAR